MSSRPEDSIGAPERPEPVRGREHDVRTGSDAVAARSRHQARWVDLQVERSMARGEFDDLPGTGKPLGDLGSPEDRDWWLRKLIEREQITGVLPAALQLRKEDAELDVLLDRETTEKRVREELEDFNHRVVEARRQLQGGPPVVTALRDVDAEVDRWHERLQARRAQTRAQRPPLVGESRLGDSRPRSRWFARKRRRWEP